MRNTKTKLLATAAVMALALGTVSKAQAFDGVDWNWDKTVTSVENITITVNDTFDWSGLVEIEKIQANIGDVTATSTVTGIDNNAAGEGGEVPGGVVQIDETFVFQVPYEDATDPDSIIPAGPVDGSGTYLSGSVLSGTIDEGQDLLTNLTFQVTGEVAFEDIILGDALDAIDLPEVVSAATAVANNQSIESSSAINLHDAQFNFGGFSEGLSEQDPRVVALQLALANADATDNAHTDALLGLTIAGALGLITQGEVSATSDVSDILNASVDSSATAVGNNLSVTLAAATAGDATVLADLTQFNYANTSADSSVTDVDINNYTNFGGAGFGNCGGCVDDALDGVQTALVSSVATAVGNNVSIKVNAPSVGVEAP